MILEGDRQDGRRALRSDPAWPHPAMGTVVILQSLFVYLIWFFVFLNQGLIRTCFVDKLGFLVLLFHPPTTHHTPRVLGLQPCTFMLGGLGCAGLCAH